MPAKRVTTQENRSAQAEVETRNRRLKKDFIIYKALRSLPHFSAVEVILPNWAPSTRVRAEEVAGLIDEIYRELSPVVTGRQTRQTEVGQ